MRWTMGYRRRCPYQGVLSALSLLGLFVVALIRCASATPDWYPDRSVIPRERINKRDYEKLSDASLRAVPGLADPAPILNHKLPSSLLSAILIPRPPDTQNSTIVREKILSVFQKQLGKDSKAGRTGWHVETPSFTASTPQGKKRMTNIVLTKNPSAPKRLVLAAHYDSKWFPTSSGMQGFVGATDSAAPCAILVDTAIALDAILDAKERQLQEMIKTGKGAPRSRIDDTTLQIIFLDGEEAYGQWTHEDSIYGAKDLVSSWKMGFWDPFTYEKRDELEARRFEGFNHPIRKIDTIEHFVLLDLLGAKEPNVPSYFKATDWLHKELRDIEKRLGEQKALTPDGASLKPFLSSMSPWGGIEDDHLPFLANGVPILHLITNPFPNVWHRLSDDGDALDYPTVHAWAMIMRAFVAEYLGLDLSAGQQKRDVESRHVHKELQ